MQLGLHRVRGAQHVTVNVVGGRQCVQPQLVQQLVHRLHVAFQNAVKLESLTVGQANAAVQRALLGKLINAQPLLRADNTAGQTAAQHHRMARLQFLLGALARISRSSC